MRYFSYGSGEHTTVEAKVNAFSVSIALVYFVMLSASDDRRHPAAGNVSKEHTGSADQLDELIAQYGRMVFRVAFSITHSNALAEEVVQDTMFRAWTSMPSWENDVPPRWLRTVARNTAISVMRKESRSAAEDQWDDELSPAPGIERVVEGRGMVDAMHAALATMDERSRTMIVLRETEELSYEEIGDLLDMTPTAVKAKLYRARHQLKALLRDWDI